MPIGIAELIGRGRHTLEIDLAPLLGVASGDLDGRDYARARRQLARRIARQSPRLARRLHLSSDAYDVYVSGRTADEIAVARIAHRMVLGRPAPVLL